MWNSSEALGASTAGPVSVGTMLGRLAGELRQSRAGLLALETSITALTRSARDPAILHALQRLDLVGQELAVYAEICGRLREELPEGLSVDAADLLGPVTLDDVKARLLGHVPAGAGSVGDADFF